MFQNKNDRPVGLNVIIVGCGKVGSTLVEQLVLEGHDITIIDTNPLRIEELTNLYDIMGVVGNGASYSIQTEAGVEKADLLIAVTGSDELNLLCCTIAKRNPRCSTISRVRNPDYNKEIDYLSQQLKLAMVINPELEAAKEMARILYLPTALEVSPFAHGQAELVRFKVPENNVLNGMTLYRLPSLLSVKVLVCAVERDGRVEIPTGNSVIQTGDIISFVAHRSQVLRFFEQIYMKTKKVNSTLIIGGGKSTYYLASHLINAGIRVKIIEQNLARCEELSILLPKAIIIHGDGTDEKLLKEEGIETIESFVPLTGIDEENVMLTLHARRLSNAKVITKINRLSFKQVINSLELGSVIYPRMITSEAIIAYVRAKKNSIDSNIETLYHLCDRRIEAIEFSIDKDSKATNIPLMEMKLKDQVLVAFINRKGRIILPSGKDSIHVGDTVMVVTHHTGFDEIEDILA